MKQGYTVIQMSNDQLAKFYECKDLYLTQVDINEYLVIQNLDGEIVDIQCRTKDGFVPRKCYKLETKIDGTIKPRNLEQQLAFDLLARDEVPLKILSGNFGSGRFFATC